MLVWTLVTPFSVVLCSYLAGYDSELSCDRCGCFLLCFILHYSLFSHQLSKSGQRALSCFVSARADIWILAVIFQAAAQNYFPEGKEISEISGTFLWLVLFRPILIMTKEQTAKLQWFILNEEKQLYHLKQQNEITLETYTDPLSSEFCIASRSINKVITSEWRNKENAHLLTEINNNVEVCLYIIIMWRYASTIYHYLYRDNGICMSKLKCVLNNVFVMVSHLAIAKIQFADNLNFQDFQYFNYIGILPLIWRALSVMVRKQCLWFTQTIWT